MRTVLAASCLVAALAAAIPEPAFAYPSGAWRTRSTGLDTPAKCTRRAFRAMKNADLGGKASGEAAVFGNNIDAIVYVVCAERGRLAVVFCSSDRTNSGNYIAQVCDTVARLMER